jgi:hypothetical protein
MSIITRFLYKIKHLILANQEEVGVSLIIIFVALSSFFLGKYSIINGGVEEEITFRDETDTVAESKADAKPAEQVTKTTESNQGTSEQVVASKNGTKYYLPWCGSAARILDKNKVFFASALEAERAGFAKATNCKGL